MKSLIILFIILAGLSQVFPQTQFEKGMVCFSESSFYSFSDSGGDHNNAFFEHYAFSADLSYFILDNIELGITAKYGHTKDNTRSYGITDSYVTESIGIGPSITAYSGDGSPKLFAFAKFAYNFADLDFSIDRYRVVTLISEDDYNCVSGTLGIGVLFHIYGTLNFSIILQDEIFSQYKNDHNIISYGGQLKFIL